MQIVLSILSEFSRYWFCSFI